MHTRLLLVLLLLLPVCAMSQTAETDRDTLLTRLYERAAYLMGDRTARDSGRLTLSLRTDLKYTQAKFSGNMLILYGDTECEIYSGQGVLKYAGAFDTAIADLYKTSGFQRYVVVFSDRTDTIKLK